MQQAEIIAVGSELLTPQRVDTNSLYLTDQLNALGVEVRRKLVVGDHRALLAAAIRHALADALSRTLVLRQDLRDQLEERFRRMQRRMAENNLRQAYVVEGAEPLPNPRGTAPGQWLEQDGSVILLLPGPPHELKAV